MGSLLGALATIIVTGLAALLALPYFVDWNSYKTQFEAQAAKLVGRPVMIDGDIDLTILPVPRLSLRGLRISDEFGKFERPFAEVDTFNIVLSLPPLLSGTMEAKSIQLDQPIIRLKIDEFGEGTWQSVGPYGMNIPLPVREVVLNRVDIKDGAIELRRARQPPARFDRISGTFSADSLSGPFRFAGFGSVGGGDKEINLSAVRSKTERSLRLKAALRSIDGVSLYQLDGEIKGLDGPVHYVGPVAARLALDSKAKQAEPGQIAEPLPGKAIEMKASAKITLEDAKFDDITLTVTQNDRPQSVTGSAYASWNGVPKLDLSIEASWLDIDHMLRLNPGTERPVPGMAIAALPRVFEGWSFKPRRGQITAKIQQAGLGGDVIEGLDFVASHNAEGWQIETLVGKLPGDTDIDVKGTLPSGDALAFNGNFTLRGRNLSRLLRWSSPSLGVVDTGSAETFSLSSEMTLTPERLAFRDAKGSLGKSAFTGDLVHDYGKDSRLLLALESEHLDLRPLYSNRHEATAEAGQPNVTPVDPHKSTDDWTAQTVPARKTSLADVLSTVFKADQSNVSLLITRLQLPDFEARDVRSAFRYEKGTFDIRELNVATTDGLKVTANGRITGFESKPNGALKLSIDAPSAQSVTNLARLAGLDSVSRGARRRMEALSPFQLSGSLDAVARDSAVTLTLAGNAGGSELTFRGRLRGSLEELGNASVDVDGVIGNADGRRLIAQLAPEVPLEKAASQAGAGFVKVTALGTVKSGLASRIELRTPQARGHFEGQIALLDEPSWRLAGDLDLRASQAATALSMLRLSPGGTPVTGAIDVRASISKKASQYQVADLQLRIGNQTIRGKVDVDVSGERPVAKIDIDAASVALPKIAAYLVDWDHQDVTAQIADAAGGGPGLWPNQAFSLASLRTIDGTISVKAPSIVLSDDVALSEGQLKASLQAGKLTLSAFKGRIYGGTLTASGSLEALNGRAGANGSLKLQGVDLAALSRAQGGNQVVSGKGDLDLSFEGQGISPRGLISVLSGKGQLDLEKGSFYGLTPSALHSAARTYLKQEIPDKAQLTAKLEGEFRQGRLPFKAEALPIVLKDGVARISQADFAGSNYQATADLTVDLASLRFDSEWRIAYSEEIDAGQTLPPVRLVFAGPMDSFSSSKPQVYADEFERFLTIKRMDQDMDKLEKLNEQRGIPRSSMPPRNQPVSRGGTPTARSEEPGNSGASIPAQSLLHAPPVVLDEPPITQQQPTAAPPQPYAVPSASAPRNADKDPAKEPATGNGWSTGMEENKANLPNAWDTQAQRDAVPQGDFEAQIREVLRAQERQRTSPQ